MLRLLRNSFFVFSTLFMLTLPCAGHAIGSGLPPEEYFEAQKYPYRSGWGYNNYWTINDADMALVLAQQDNKLKVFIFEKRELALAKGKEKPDLLYESPDLVIHPSIYNPRESLKSRIRYDEAHQAFFIAYGNENDSKSDIGYAASSFRDKEFAVHGYLLIPLTPLIAPSSEPEIEKTAETVNLAYEVISFEGIHNRDQPNDFAVTVKAPIQVTDETLQEKVKAILVSGWPVYNWTAYEKFVFPKHLVFDMMAQENEQMKALKKLYVQVATTQFGSSEFYKYFDELDAFFKNNSYQSLDPEHQHPHYVLWLTDYGYWLLKLGRAEDAVNVLYETVKRDSNNAAKYLTLANAQLEFARQRRDDREKDYYTAAAQDSYRAFCMLMLKQEKTIQSDTEDKLKQVLRVEALTSQTCIPYMFLIDAILDGDLTKVQSLIDQGLSPNLVVYRNYARSPLEFAILKNNVAMVDLLLKNGADPKVVLGKDNGAMGLFAHAHKSLQDRAQKTPDDQPLDTRVADLLLQHGADINAQTLNESWVLMEAVKYDPSERVLRYLLQNGADPDFKKVTTYHTPLITALESKNLEFANILVAQSQADVNRASYGSVSIGNGESVYNCKSPLYFYLDAIESRGGTVSKENLDLLKLLFAKGADPAVGGPSTNENCTDKNGWAGIEGLTRKIQSTELRCEIDKHRPADVPVNEMNPLCPANGN